jgi:hypothetical protein
MYGMKRLVPYAVVVAALAVNAQGQGEDEAAELAKKLANPVASLISVPIQANYDENIGPEEAGSAWRVNIQPVIPISLNEDWNLISRTILPVIDQEDVPVEGMGESGIGDVLQSLFFSPKEPGKRGWIWGAGPVLLLPTGSDETLSTEKWGVGPTAVGLKQVGPWTYGALVNHVWDVAGEDDRAHVNATFLQPFLTYITKTKTTFALNTEATYDWDAEEWSVPINCNVLQLLKIGPQIIQVGVGARYWADAPDNAADEWGFRTQLTFLFPK